MRVTLFSAVLLLLSGCSQPRPPRPTGPNVLFVSIDDLRPALGCYGDAHANTPRLDTLAERGLVFTRAYCQQATCAPSRASVLTGLRPDSSGVRDLSTHFRDVVPDVVTLPQHFKNHGYHTVGLGKVFHSGQVDKPSWSEPQWTPDKRVPRAYMLDDNVELSKRNEKYGPPTERATVADDGYPDGKLAERAILTLRRLKQKPFFLAVGFYKPHLPFTAPEAFWRLYVRGALPLEEPGAEGVPGPALHNSGELRRYVGVPKNGALPEPLARTLVHGYYACASYVDAQLGKILDELERLGLADNTIVCVWGDHGFHLGDHGIWTKQTNFELATRVPLILATPGAGAQKTTALVELVDLYPTLCELTGLPLPAHLEGRSLTPLLAAPESPFKNAAFSQVHRSGRKLEGRSVRTERYRFTRWTRSDTGEPLGSELYDHTRDPEERTNLADSEPNTVAELTRLLD